MKTQIDPDKSRKTTSVKNDREPNTTETVKPFLKTYWSRIKTIPLRKKIGFTLLIPGIWSVISFSLITLFGENLNNNNNIYTNYDPYVEAKVQMENFGSHWIGRRGENGGYSSSLPIYIGLMTIAGAYLIKD